MRKIHTINQKIWLSLSLLAIHIVSNAQPGPPNPNGGGGDEPVGGASNIGDEYYLWLIPIMLYMAYHIYTLLTNKKQASA